MHQPWARVKNPCPIPAPVDEVVYRVLDDDSLAQVIRDHILPRSEDAPYREAWAQLWALLEADDDLADRALDVLEDFIDGTEADIDGGELSSQQLRRARMYLKRFSDRWERLDNANPVPLQWAGKAAEGLPMPARRVVEKLVNAIDAHRAGTTNPTTVDKTLWGILAKTGLDPAVRNQDPRGKGQR